MGALLLLAAAIAFAGWLFFRRGSGFGPTTFGTVVYDDAGRTRPEKVLVSDRHGLRGKPDYIARGPDGHFPVEVKSRSCGRSGPHDGEKAQLFAYCLLLEDATGGAVRSGVIEYGNCHHRVPFGDTERNWILGILAEMRAAGCARDVARNHRHARRCAACGFRNGGTCGQALQ
jgi:CRISPR-associated exonuclease Cas4